MEKTTMRSNALIAALIGLLVTLPARADESLAKAAQNPVADLISLPIQHNADLQFGPDDEYRSVTNIQPVLPFRLNDDYNLITRTILPIVSVPGIAPGESRETGIGDTSFTAFVSPANSEGLTWGAGPVLLLPTSSDERLGADEWGAGVSAVVLAMPGRWVVGSLVSNVWDIDGDTDINLFTWQYFVNYNFNDGWYFTSAPIITANWEADSSDRWTVPVGAGFGKIFRVGKQPMNFNLQGFYYVEAPEVLGDWALRAQLQFMFPK
jgi:hypothetical protein